MVGRVADAVDVVAGEVQVSAGGAIGLTGGDRRLSSFGEVSGNGWRGGCRCGVCDWFGVGRGIGLSGR